MLVKIRACVSKLEHVLDVKQNKKFYNQKVVIISMSVHI
jgi:hypothetical protein